jgi:hypothetical protein
MIQRSTFLLVFLFSQACAHRRAIVGTIIDRNGEPMDRVVVSLKPGQVEVITDSEGSFRIDYLRDERGNRTHLNSRREYELEAFRPGFHVTQTGIYYKRGEQELDALTLVEDTIKVQPGPSNLDPAAYPDRTHSSGATYEGE